MHNSQNRLLASLPKAVFGAMQPHLKTIQLILADVLAEPGSAVTQIYFPHSGVISLVVELASGQMIETAMVGADGVFNASAALDGRVTLNKAIVQLSGTASVLPVDRLRDIADEFVGFRSTLIRHEQVLFAESQQSAACNSTHRAEARLCRWLLRMRDLAGDNALTVTQEFLAQMMGVTRPSVSIVANTLQKAGFIEYRRGHIRILDGEALEENTCECYKTIKGFYELLLSPKDESLPTR